MFVVLESNSVLVYSSNSKLVYQSYDIVDFIKFSPDVLVVITEDSIDFVIEKVTDGIKHVVSSRDTSFKEVTIYKQMLFIRRGGVLDCVDVYNNKLELIIRIHAVANKTWRYINTFLKIPVRFMKPLYMDETHVYLKHKTKIYALDIVTQKLELAKSKDTNKILLAPILNKLKIN